MGLTTDPARAIQFEQSDKPGEIPGKKVSLMDYFYSRVLIFLCCLMAVQYPTATTGITLCLEQERYFPSHGSRSRIDLTDCSYVKLFLGNVSCANLMSVKPLLSSRLLAQLLPHVFNLSKKGLLSAHTKITRHSISQII